MNNQIRFAEMMPVNSCPQLDYQRYSEVSAKIRIALSAAADTAMSGGLELSLAEVSHNSETVERGRFVFDGKASYRHCYDRKEVGITEESVSFVFQEGSLIVLSGRSRGGRKFLEKLQALMGYELVGIKQVQKHGLEAEYIEAAPKPALQEKPQEKARASPTFGKYMETATRGGWGN